MGRDWKRTTLGFILCLSIFSTFLMAQKDIPSLVKHFPAATSDLEKEYNTQILSLGSDGIYQICRMLLPPGQGDDHAARYALNGLANYVSRPGAESETAIYLQAVHKAIASSANSEITAFLIRRLQAVAHNDSVEILAGFLHRERLCDPAAQALLAIGSDVATQALKQALATAQGNSRITIVQALGQLRCGEAVKQILPIASSDNETLRQVALYALANIGDPVAAESLDQAYQSATDRNVSTHYLLFARRLAEKGYRAQAEKILRTILKTKTGSDQAHLRVSALTALVALDNAIDYKFLIKQVVSSNDMAFRMAALKLASHFPGEQVTQDWCQALGKASPQAKSDMMMMLAQRGDKSALWSLEQMLGDENPQVRLAAIEACGYLGREKALPSLVTTLQKDRSEEEIKAIKQVLLQLPTDEMVSHLAVVWDDSPVRAKILILEVFAERRAKEYKNLAFESIHSNDRVLCRAAIKACRDLADNQDLAQLIDLMMTHSRKSERTAGQKVLAALANSIVEPHKRASAVLDKLAMTGGEDKTYLLGTLAMIGGRDALAAVINEQQNADPVVKEAAIRALTDWPTMDALDNLLAMAENSQLESKYKILALRGCVRLIQSSDLNAGEKIRKYRKLFVLAQRTEEKKRIMAGLGDIATLESLQTVAGYIESPELQTEAALAIYKIISENQTAAMMDEAVIIPIMQKIKDNVSDEKSLEQINALMAQYHESLALNRLTDAEKNEGFIRLFNGWDLTGWKRHDNLPGHGMAGKWWVENNAITGIQDPPGQGGFLTTLETFEDFDLRLETKIDWPLDTGIFLRVGPRGKSHQVTLDYRPGGQIGGIYCPWTQGFVHQCPDGIKLFKKDVWNEIRIICQGEPAHIQVWVNGTLVTDFQHTTETTKGIPATGTLALQLHPGGEGFDKCKTRFRKIRLKKM